MSTNDSSLDMELDNSSSIPKILIEQKSPTKESYFHKFVKDSLSLPPSENLGRKIKILSPSEGRLKKHERAHSENQITSFAESTLTPKQPSKTSNIELFKEEERAKELETDFFLIEKLLEVRKKVNEATKLYEKCAFQDPSTIYHLILSKELAAFLIDHKELLSKEFIRLTLTYLFELPKDKNFANATDIILNELLKNKSLFEEIDKIDLPQKENAHGRHIIENSLLLSPLTPLTNKHAKVAALSALLYHLRQGNSGSCFATYLAIEQQIMNPIDVIRDFKGLISDGGLTREIDGKKILFPYLESYGLEEMDQTIILNENGEILSYEKMKCENKMSLLESPAILDIFHYFGKEATKKNLSDCLHKSYPKMKAIPFTLQTLIEFIGKNASNERITKACLRFSSHSLHPLLKCWENAIAGMSEGKKEGVLNVALLDAIKKLFTPLFSKKDKALDHLIKKVKAEIHYLYDPTIKKTGESERGAFLLYTGKRKDRSDWVKINNAKEFKVWIEKITLMELSNPLESHELREKIENIISSNDFLHKFLKIYSVDNNIDALKTKQLDYVSFVPWKARMGNDPKMVYKIYFELNELSKFESFYPRNGEDLFKIISKKISSLSMNEKNEYQKRNITLSPLRLPGSHTFSLLLSHHTMKMIYNPKFKVDLWISENIKKPIKKNIDDPLSENEKKSIEQEILKTIVPTGYGFKFRESFQKLDTKLSNMEFRKEVVSILVKYPHYFNEEEIKKRVDEIILKSWSPLKLNEWKKTVVHIADANWQEGVQDVHLALAVNPGSGELELMSILEDGSPLEIYDQKELFNDTPWEG